MHTYIHTRCANGRYTHTCIDLHTYMYTYVRTYCTVRTCMHTCWIAKYWGWIHCSQVLTMLIEAMNRTVVLMTVGVSRLWRRISVTRRCIFTPRCATILLRSKRQRSILIQRSEATRSTETWRSAIRWTKRFSSGVAIRAPLTNRRTRRSVS